ncbi:platelet-binding protein [Cystoisospora suis]|uniref:Platelet-binding protein n=1 Tax=Cystoisospora suis TaxID=483139 RepID=A0A2C6LHB4_9APIC|nr:platelet-binding protein [Cystoisospora suis]
MAARSRQDAFPALYCRTVHAVFCSQCLSFLLLLASLYNLSTDPSSTTVSAAWAELPSDQFLVRRRRPLRLPRYNPGLREQRNIEEAVTALDGLAGDDGTRSSTSPGTLRDSRAKSVQEADFVDIVPGELGEGTQRRPSATTTPGRTSPDDRQDVRGVSKVPSERFDDEFKSRTTGEEEPRSERDTERRGGLDGGRPTGSFSASVPLDLRPAEGRKRTDLLFSLPSVPPTSAHLFSGPDAEKPLSLGGHTLGEETGNPSTMMFPASYDSGDGSHLREDVLKTHGVPTHIPNPRGSIAEILNRNRFTPLGVAGRAFDDHVRNEYSKGDNTGEGTAALQSHRGRAEFRSKDSGAPEGAHPFFSRLSPTTERKSLGDAAPDRSEANQPDTSEGKGSPSGHASTLSRTESLHRTIDQLLGVDGNGSDSDAPRHQGEGLSVSQMGRKVKGYDLSTSRRPPVPRETRRGTVTSTVDSLKALLDSMEREERKADGALAFDASTRRRPAADVQSNFRPTFEKDYMEDDVEGRVAHHKGAHRRHDKRQDVGEVVHAFPVKGKRLVEPEGMPAPPFGGRRMHPGLGGRRPLRGDRAAQNHHHHHEGHGHFRDNYRAPEAAPLFEAGKKTNESEADFFGIHTAVPHHGHHHRPNRFGMGSRGEQTGYLDLLVPPTTRTESVSNPGGHCFVSFLSGLPHREMQDMLLAVVEADPEVVEALSSLSGGDEDDGRLPSTIAPAVDEVSVALRRMGIPRDEESTLKVDILIRKFERLLGIYAQRFLYALRRRIPQNATLFQDASMAEAFGRVAKYFQENGPALSRAGVQNVGRVMHNLELYKSIDKLLGLYCPPYVDVIEKEDGYSTLDFSLLREIQNSPAVRRLKRQALFPTGFHKFAGEVNTSAAGPSSPSHLLSTAPIRKVNVEDGSLSGSTRAPSDILPPQVAAHLTINAHDLPLQIVQQGAGELTTSIPPHNFAPDNRDVSEAHSVTPGDVVDRGAGSGEVKDAAGSGDKAPQESPDHVSEEVVREGHSAKDAPVPAGILSIVPELSRIVSWALNFHKLPVPPGEGTQELPPRKMPENLEERESGATPEESDRPKRHIFVVVPAGWSRPKKDSDEKMQTTSGDQQASKTEEAEGETATHALVEPTETHPQELDNLSEHPSVAGDIHQSKDRSAGESQETDVTGLPAWTEDVGRDSSPQSDISETSSSGGRSRLSNSPQGKKMKSRRSRRAKRTYSSTAARESLSGEVGSTTGEEDKPAELSGSVAQVPAVEEETKTSLMEKDTAQHSEDTSDAASTEASTSSQFDSLPLLLKGNLLGDLSEFSDGTPIFPFAPDGGDDLNMELPGPIDPIPGHAGDTQVSTEKESGVQMDAGPGDGGSLDEASIEGDITRYEGGPEGFTEGSLEGTADAIWNVAGPQQDNLGFGGAVESSTGDAASTSPTSLEDKALSSSTEESAATEANGRIGKDLSEVAAAPESDREDGKRIEKSGETTHTAVEGQRSVESSIASVDGPESKEGEPKEASGRLERKTSKKNVSRNAKETGQDMAAGAAEREKNESKKGRDDAVEGEVRHGKRRHSVRRGRHDAEGRAGESKSAEKDGERDQGKHEREVKGSKRRRSLKRRGHDAEDAAGRRETGDEERARGRLRRARDDGDEGEESHGGRRRSKKPREEEAVQS